MCCICNHKSWPAFKLKAKFNQHFSKLQRRERGSKLTKREIPSLRAVHERCNCRSDIIAWDSFNERQGRTAKQNLFSTGSRKTTSNIEPSLYFHLYMFWFSWVLTTSTSKLKTQMLWLRRTPSCCRNTEVESRFLLSFNRVNFHYFVSRYKICICLKHEHIITTYLASHSNRERCFCCLQSRVSPE